MFIVHFCNLISVFSERHTIFTEFKKGDIQYSLSLKREAHTIFTEFKKGDIQYSLSLKRETYNIH